MKYGPFGEKPYRRCPICDEEYLDETPFMLQCEQETCDTWIHISCLGIAYVDYERLNDSNYVLYCPKCITEGTESQRKTKRKKNRDLLMFAAADSDRMEYYLRLRAPNGQKAAPTGPLSSAISKNKDARAAAGGADGKGGTNLVPPSGTRKGASSPVSRTDGLPLLLVKPPEAYMMFKFSLESANPALTPEELQQVAVREWRAISNAERRRYISDAEKLMQRYKRDCADFFLEDTRRKEQYAADRVVRRRAEARSNNAN